jgi:hypothetical protein
MTFLFLPLLTWAAFAAAFADAVVTKGDANDPKFLADIQDAPFFVSFYQRGNCAGTIIGDHHVLTAAHCVGDARKSPKTILFDGSTVQPWGAFMNPNCIFSVQNDGPNGCDVAVLAYEENIVDMLAAAGVEALLTLPMYPNSDEVGKTITIYGYGLSGDAGKLTGKNGCKKAKDDARFRKAQNIVTDTSDGVVRYKMDNANGLDLEGMAQDGDSGGAATVTVGGTTYLVGANSGTFERNSCDYGSDDEYSRVSEHYDFVTKILDYPNDQTICPWKEWEKPNGGDSYDKTCCPVTENKKRSFRFKLGGKKIRRTCKSLSKQSRKKTIQICNKKVIGKGNKKVISECPLTCGKVGLGNCSFME